MFLLVTGTAVLSSRLRVMGKKRKSVSFSDLPSSATGDEGAATSSSLADTGDDELDHLPSFSDFELDERVLSVLIRSHVLACSCSRGSYSFVELGLALYFRFVVCRLLEPSVGKSRH